MTPCKGSVCSAFNCSNNQKKTPELSFFRFPKDPVRNRLWLINLGRKDLMNKSVDYLYNNIKLCSNHFEDGQFMNTNRNKLVWNAVPTLFDIPNPPPPVKRKLRTRKYEALRKKLRQSFNGDTLLQDCASTELDDFTSVLSNKMCDASTQTELSLNENDIMLGMLREKYEYKSLEVAWLWKKYKEVKRNRCVRAVSRKGTEK